MFTLMKNLIKYVENLIPITPFFESKMEKKIVIEREF